MVFASQTCGPCAQMLPELVRWSETLEERLAFALIESDVRDVEALAEQISSHGAILTLLDDGHDVASAYDVAATPTAVLVGADGRIASWHASGAGNIEGLIRSALEGPAAIQGVVAA
jgi:thiol-disulfide isomerase/thioredoxin